MYREVWVWDWAVWEWEEWVWEVWAWVWEWVVCQWRGIKVEQGEVDAVEKRRTGTIVRVVRVRVMMMFRMEGLSSVVDAGNRDGGGIRIIEEDGGGGKMNTRRMTRFRQRAHHHTTPDPGGTVGTTRTEAKTAGGKIRMEEPPLLETTSH